MIDDNSKEFIKRHIGPSEDEQSKMLQYVGYKSLEDLMENTVPEKIISPGTYDQKHIARIGHLHDCIAYGPGILDLAHQPDEYVVIDDMVKSSQVMALATLKLLGLEV